MQLKNNESKILMTQGRNIYCYLIILLLISPNIIWIILDHRVWPWDQAWYGEVSVQLFYNLIHSPLDWFNAMISAFGTKAPGIAWLGQFFVPIGQLIGSIDIGLLLSIVTTQFLILLLIYHIIVKLTDSCIISISCCLFAASAPLSVGLTHQYFVEPLQTLCATWIILIMVFAPEWNTQKIILHLLSSVSLAMLAKVTSPLYVFLPILAIVYYIYSEKNIKNGLTQVKTKTFLSKIKPLYIITFLLISGVLLWYSKNIKNILSFAIQSSSGEVSLLYGQKADFLTKIQYWLSASQKSFFTPTSLVFIVTLSIYILIKVFINTQKINRKIELNYFEICTIISVMTISIVLTFFSFQVNQENRYLLPLLPYFAVFLSWILDKVNQEIIVYFISLLFILQLLIVQGQALGITSVNSNLSNWLYPLERSSENLRLLTAVVDFTCNNTGKDRYNVIGLELPWFNANSASYISAKQMLGKDFRCYYTSLGYAEKDTEKTWQRLFDLKINYFVTLPPDLHPKVHDAFNEVALPVLERIEKSSKFKQDSFVDNLSVLLYRSKDY